jgi:hypothetical protein
MMPVHEADKRHRDACERFIVDSSIQRDDIGNQEALDMAAELDAEMVVLADVWQEAEATVEAILDGLELYDGHEFEGGVLTPLQPPHGESYLELEGQGIDLFGIGGIKDAPDQVRLDAVREFRNAAGYDVDLHGFGFGVTDELVRAVREEPRLLDSIDYSTPMQSHGLAGGVEPGAERMSVAAARAGARLIEDIRRVSPYVESDERTRQVGFGDFRARADGGVGDGR